MRQLCNVTVLLLLFGLMSCQNNGDKQTTMSPVKVKVLRVSSSEMDGTERFSGTVEEANSTSLSFSIMGTVKTVHVGLGDRVAKANLLLRSIRFPCRAATMLPKPHWHKRKMPIGE